MTETKRLVLVAKVTDKIGSEGKDVKSTFSTLTRRKLSRYLDSWVSGRTFFCFVTNHAFDKDGRTDSFLVARPRCMQCAVKTRFFGVHFCRRQYASDSYRRTGRTAVNNSAV